MRISARLFAFQDTLGKNNGAVAGMQMFFRRGCAGTTEGIFESVLRFQPFPALRQNVAFLRARTTSLEINCPRWWGVTSREPCGNGAIVCIVATELSGRRGRFHPYCKDCCILTDNCTLLLCLIVGRGKCTNFSRMYWF